MTPLTPGQTVMGTFAPGARGQVVGSYPFPGVEGEPATLTSGCTGYAPETLTVRVSLRGVVLAQGRGAVSLTLPATDTYTVELVTP